MILLKMCALRTAALPLGMMLCAAIALKSGWDEYDIAFGNEMYCGISNVLVEKVHLYNSLNGVEFRTTKGRGSYIREIIISDVDLQNIHMAFGASSGTHPDDNFDPNCFPVLDQITLQDIVGRNPKP
uniref:Polygalacturonase n=1 Tax=Mangifera indica TaxID=29780 RepID=A0A514YDD6_MANIN|nr:polygalacturonase [Mangifera indica]